MVSCLSGGHLVGPQKLAVRSRNCQVHAKLSPKGPKNDPAPDEQFPNVLDPVELGRRSRQALDEVWAQVTRLSSPTSSFSLEGTEVTDSFESPQAPFTNVLVVGGTGRIGRIVVRKLLLRGYAVKVFVRDSDGTAKERLPSSVELRVGDVGNLADCQRAMEGIDKVIYCASSRLAIAADMTRVDQDGVGNMSRAFMDAKHRAVQKTGSRSRFLKTMLADFATPASQEAWDLLHLGPPLDNNNRSQRGYKGQDFGTAMISPDLRRVEFTGNTYSRNGIAEWGGPVPQGTLADHEGIVTQLLSDGKPYIMILVDAEGHSYQARFATRLGYNNVRLPFNTFRPMDRSYPPLDPGQVTMLKFRFDKSQIPESAIAKDVPVEDERKLRNSFSMALRWVKALPTGDEPAFVLVSCAGAGQNLTSLVPSGGKGNTDWRKVAAKRRGENGLRNSGLGYTIVRPGPLVEEPGGYKAMVFDQGDRLSESIGFADVADVCLRSLHDSAAFNKTFEVGYEYEPEAGEEVYELVAHLPDKSNNYLAPALAALERNT